MAPLTPLHRLHPSGKIVLLALFFAWAMCFTTPAGTLLVLIVALLGIALAGSWTNLRKVLPLLLPVTLMCLLLWSLFAEGHTALWHWRSLIVYREGIAYAVAMAVRLDAMLFGGLVFIATTSIEELRLGLVRLRLLFPVAFAISLAFRLVPVFAGTLEKVVHAQKSRGLALDTGNPIARMKKHVPLIVPVILLSLRNVDQLAAALEARGYGSEGKRSSYLARPWRFADSACCVVGVLVLAGTIVLRFL